MTLLLVTGLVLAACGSPNKSADSGSGSSDSKDPIKVAFIGDLTGPVAPYSTASRDAAQVAFDEANAAGGIDGRMIEMKAFDDKNDPIQTVNIAKREASSSAAVILASASSNVLAAAPELEKAGVPFFVTVSSNPQVTTSGWEWVNRVHLSDADQIERILDYGVETLSLQRIGILHDTTDLGQGGLQLAEAKMAELGQKLVSNQSYNFGANDFSTQVNALRDANVDGVLCWCLTDAGARVTEQMRALKMTDVQILGGGGIVSDKFIELAGPAAEGTFASWAYVDQTDATVQHLTTTYKANTGRDVDVFAAQSYDAASILVAALKEAGSDAAPLQKAIRASEHTGAVGPLTFDETGQNVRNVSIGEVVGGEWTLVE